MMQGKTKNLGLFESTTLQLTGWYVLILMIVSLLFSGVVYELGTSEFNNALRPQRFDETIVFNDGSVGVNSREQRIQESSQRLLFRLVIFNGIVLIGGSVLSYLLARKTLRPIEDAHDAQSRFASDAAHELRTPLAVMQTELEVGLRDKKATSASQRSVMKSSLEEIARLRTLTDRLLLLASQQDIPLQSIDIEPATVDAVTHVVPLAQKKNISIENNVSGGVVQGHAESIADILGILLDNAIKYSPEKTTILISQSKSHHMLSIHVKDQGPGISASDQSKIFERFYRTDTSRSKENIEGHGLGLSLAKRLADEMGGTVSVRSNGKSGSMFTLTLPM